MNKMVPDFQQFDLCGQSIGAAMRVHSKAKSLSDLIGSFC